MEASRAKDSDQNSRRSSARTRSPGAGAGRAGVRRVPRRGRPRVAVRSGWVEVAHRAAEQPWAGAGPSPAVAVGLEEACPGQAVDVEEDHEVGAQLVEGHGRAPVAGPRQRQVGVARDVDDAGPPGERSRRDHVGHQRVAHRDDHDVVGTDAAGRQGRVLAGEVLVPSVDGGDDDGPAHAPSTASRTGSRVPEARSSSSRAARAAPSPYDQRLQPSPPSRTASRSRPGHREGSGHASTPTAIPASRTARTVWCCSRKGRGSATTTAGARAAATSATAL